MRKLWNRPALPVWSLVTSDKSGQMNMNICSYVMSTSMTPKLMTVAVYHGTKTLENLETNPQQSVLLQLLAEDQAPLVRLLGQQSGFKVDKLSRLKKRCTLEKVGDHVYLVDSLGYMILTSFISSEVGGDHILYTGEVQQVKNLNDRPILTTEYLRDQGYTR